MAPTLRPPKATGCRRCRNCVEDSLLRPTSKTRSQAPAWERTVLEAPASPAPKRRLAGKESSTRIRHLRFGPPKLRAAEDAVAASKTPCYGLHLKLVPRLPAWERTVLEAPAFPAPKRRLPGKESSTQLRHLRFSHPKLRAAEDAVTASKTPCYGLRRAALSRRDT